MQWAYSIDDNSGYSGEHRPWIRRILCQAADGAETPPGRTAFAQAMNDFYWGLNLDPIWTWNQTYYEEVSEPYYDFRISRFMEADDPDSRYAGYPSLEKMPNPDCEECMETPYPGGINENNNDDIGDWLMECKSDLGYVLTVDDAEEFTRVMAAHYYPMVIDAIRFFDGCHLISSANFNWFRKGADYEKMEQFYPVFEEMSKATGNVFTEGEKDIISYINTQFYPAVPEKSDSRSSYESRHRLLGVAFNNFLEKGLRGLPFMVASYTSHADWDKEWDANWHEEVDPAPCPKNDDPIGDERWYDCAPFPHGNQDNCDGPDVCYDPLIYTYTETGLLNRIVVDEQGGRGDDYNLITSALFYSDHLGTPPVDYKYILGFSWHSFYDSGFDRDGFETADCDNWGIVNPKCPRSWEPTSGEEDQYIELHDFIRDMNGYIQEQFGGGTTWSTRPGPDPPPETTDPYESEE